MKDTPRGEPSFRLKDLGMSEGIIQKLEAYLIQQLVDMEKCHILSKLPGLSPGEAYVLGAAIREIYLEKPVEPEQVYRFGMERLLRAVGEHAPGVELGEDFYVLTPEKAQAMTERLQYGCDRCGQWAIELTALRFGLNDGQERTYTRCVRELRCHLDTSQVRNRVNNCLNVLAKQLVPMYARDAFSAPEEIDIAYLQLSTRPALAISRMGVKTVADLIKKSPGQLRKQAHNLGPISLEEVKKALKICGYSLA